MGTFLKTSQHRLIGLAHAAYYVSKHACSWHLMMDTALYMYISIENLMLQTQIYLE